MSANVSALPRVNAERITVSLTRRSSLELAELSDSTGMTKTDLVNRSIGLYKLMMDKLTKGFRLAFVDPTDGSVEIVHVL